MRILLLGEYSGFYRYLKEGLLELDVDVHHAANGDSMCPWKQIEGADSLLYLMGGKGIRKVYNQYVSPFNRARLFRNYDVIQIINPSLYPGFMMNHILTKQIVESNGRFVLSSAGDDYVLWKAYQKGIYEYFTYDDDYSAGRRFNRLTPWGRAEIFYQKSIIDRADLIIPCAYDYKMAYGSIPVLKEKTTNVIPLPVNCNSIEYRENVVKGKLVFFHGINREIAKGTKYIRAALLELQERYPNDVEIIINNRMPFEQYLEAMRRANVVIDQCKAYSYGMNAIIAMAQGKVVMSGNHPVSHANGDIPPVIWIQPNERQIYERLVGILSTRDQISIQGLESRNYVVNKHNHVSVARQYLEKWQSKNVF